MTHDELKHFEAYLKTFSQIPDEKIREFASKGQKRIFRKKQLFVEEGQPCTELLFIHKGIFRYFIRHEDREYTKDFAVDSMNPFCTAFSSLVTKKVSNQCIEALEDSEVSVWDESYFGKTFETPAWILFSKKIAEWLFVRKEKREISLIKDSAEIRYQSFIEEFPDLAQRIPQYCIASYLGISPESLSRIRQQRVKRRIE